MRNSDHDFVEKCGLISFLGFSNQLVFDDDLM